MRKGAAQALVVLAVLVSLLTAVGGVSAAENSLVRGILIEGNNYVDTETIRAAIVKTKLNEPATEQMLLDDLHSIFDLGYFQDASVKLEPALGGFRLFFRL